MGRVKVTWRESDHPRDRIGQFTDKDKPVVRVTFKGGQGSGNWGHAGRPGEVGGSGSGAGGRGVPAQMRQVDPFNAKLVREAPEGSMNAARRAINGMAKTVDADLSDTVVTILNDKLGEVLGLSVRVPKGPERGLKVAAISIKNIDESLAQTGTQKLTPDWLGLPRDVSLDRDIVVEHVVAHELSHKVWNGMEQGKRDSWKLLFKAHESVMSGNSRYIHAENEGFADALASFATGYDVPTVVEDWIWENL